MKNPEFVDVYLRPMIGARLDALTHVELVPILMKVARNHATDLQGIWMFVHRLHEVVQHDLLVHNMKSMGLLEQIEDYLNRAMDKIASFRKNPK